MFQAKPSNTILDELGLRFRWDFAGDPSFLLAIAAGPLALMLLTVAWPAWNSGIRLEAGLLLSLGLWQPLIEELFFRGILQRQLARRAWARASVFGISGANLITSLLFSMAHVVQHSLPWALAVMLPSLVFGYVADRFQHIYPSIFLHITYNMSYLVLGAYLSD